MKAPSVEDSIDAEPPLSPSACGSHLVTHLNFATVIARSSRPAARLAVFERVDILTRIGEFSGPFLSDAAGRDAADLFLVGDHD